MTNPNNLQCSGKSQGELREAMARICLSANTTWYLYNHRLSLARALREHGHRLLLLSPEDEFSNKLLDMDFDWRAVPLSRRGMNPFIEPYSIYRFFRRYREFSPDLVHHHTIKPMIYGSWGARLAGVPCVVNSVTGLGYMFLQPGWYGAGLAKIAATAYRFSFSPSNTHILFQNHTDRTRFIQQQIVRQGQSSVIPGSGVDTERFVPSQEPSGIPVITFASRMLWDKGVGELVEAARTLRKRGVELELWLAGEADPGNPSGIEAEILRQWEAEGHLRWLGYQEDMPRLYQQSHIVALPSYREGLPRNLLEAAACGRPVVATDVPGCRDIVQDGVNGLLVPVQDVSALAEALGQLIDNPDLRQRFGKAGRQVVESRFSNEIIIRETLTLYEKQLERHGIMDHD